MDWVREVTVGVGKYKHPFADVRGAESGRGKHLPLRIVPDLGQVLQDRLNAEGEQPEDVLDDRIPRSDL